VNDEAEPITAPDAFTKLMLPAQDAAVPPVAVVARFTTLICALSELASPMGGRFVERVEVVVVCPIAATATRSGKKSLFSFIW
jgi:hypothetical protein